MRSLIIPVQLAIPEPPEKTSIEDKSWLLRAFAQFPDDHILAFGVPELTKDESLRIFPSLTPEADGRFTLELGAVLLDRLPTLNGQVDYALDVPNIYGDDLQLCFSNQMLRLRYKVEDRNCHAMCPRIRLDEVMSEDAAPVPEHAHIEYLSTVATCRFEINGNEANDAIEENIEKCIDEFISALNQVISAQLMLRKDEEGLLTPVYDRGSFDYLYVMVQGYDKDQVAAHRLVLDVRREALNARNYDEAESKHFLALVNGTVPVDDTLRILKAAQSYIDGGLNEYALLQLAIGAEVATSRFVDKLLRAAGVSKGKLKDMQSEMTYSRMINIDVVALCPPGMKPDRNLLGSINRIRTLRNDLMHRADFSASTAELRQWHEDTERYVMFLDEVLVHQNLK